jgi:hypothetical protein
MPAGAKVSARELVLVAIYCDLIISESQYIVAGKAQNGVLTQTLKPTLILVRIMLGLKPQHTTRTSPFAAFFQGRNPTVKERGPGLKPLFYEPPLQGV